MPRVAARTQGEAGPSATQPAELDYVRRATFTQAIMQRQCMPEEEAKQIYRNLMDTSRDTGYLDMVAGIDMHISFCNFKLTRMLFPLDNSWYLAIINKTPDEVSKKEGSPLGLAGLHFLKAVLETIALSPDAEDGIGYIRSTTANNMGFTQTQAATQATQGEGSSAGTQAQGPKLSMAEKEALLPRLVAEHWLAKTPGRPGCYSIGVRSFMELKGWLLSLDLPEDTRTAWERFL